MSKIEINSGEIHIWTVWLDRPGVSLLELWQLLAADERERANRFRFERDRNHYVAGRGVLRLLIGRYLHLPPAHIPFVYGSHGKPELAPLAGKPGFAFNLSNSHGIALIGFCWGQPIGVDVEPIRPMEDAEAVAERFFSTAENEVFRAVPHHQQAEAFFNCWTRKEAFIKAVGEGLSYPLDQFEVSLRPDETARLLSVRGSQAEAARWFLHSLCPAPGFVGAVVAGGNSWTLQTFQWPPPDHR